MSCGIGLVGFSSGFSLQLSRQLATGPWLFYIHPSLPTHSRPLPAKPLRAQVCASRLYTWRYILNNAYQRTKLNKIIYRLWNKKEKKRGKSTDRRCVWAVRSGHGKQEAGPSIYLRTFCRWHLPNPIPIPIPSQGCHGLSGLNKYPLFVASRATITCQFASNFFCCSATP